MSLLLLFFFKYLLIHCMLLNVCESTSLLLRLQDNKSLHQSSSYVSLIFSHIGITEHTLGQRTVANKFLTNPTLLALMCNLGAHSVPPEGDTASVCLCMTVSLCVCGPSNGLSLARSPTGSHGEASWRTIISNPVLMKIWPYRSLSLLLFILFWRPFSPSVHMWAMVYTYILPVICSS